VIAGRSLWVHASLFVVASALGWQALTKEEEDPKAEHETVLWEVTPESVQRLELESKKKKVVLESQKDAYGRYFVGTVDKEKAKPPKNPHEQKSEADAGAPPPAEPEVVERETIRFVAAKEANELSDSLAKLTAKRTLGKLSEDRYEEFGFGGEEEMRVRFVLGGKTREFIVGGKTPGGSDSYVRDAESGQTYVIAGSVVRDIETADTSLLQRDLTEFEEDEVSKAVVRVGEASRELVPVPGQSQFWANPSDASNKDETASNWMTKFERLRVTDYVEKVEGETTPIAVVEYFDKSGKSLAQVELVSQAVAGEDKPRYLARSGVTRWHGKVLANTAEQLAQDAAGIVNP
jgi:hypothetical protein